MTIRAVTSDEIAASLPGFVDLLLDSVASGASVGFLHPLDHDLAVAFWQNVCAEVDAGIRIVVAADAGDAIAGAAHLAFATKPNALHRAEVQKLLVHTRHRGQGIARRLMQAIETEALAAGRTLLVLDTKKGDPAEGLYRQIGYTSAGEIPGYARNDQGGLDTTVIFFKTLPDR